MRTHRKRRVVLLTLLTCAWLVARAEAEPYWVAYEGDALPEEVGWKRHWGDASGPYGPGANRWIEDGVFVLDSLKDDQIFDYYDVQRPIDPAPGELFIAEWRGRVDEPSDPGDAEVVIARDYPAGHVAFHLNRPTQEGKCSATGAARICVCALPGW
jgi:hypothetical protein